jgi:hypothetical protein
MLNFGRKKNSYAVGGMGMGVPSNAARGGANIPMLERGPVGGFPQSPRRPTAPGPRTGGPVRPSAPNRSPIAPVFGGSDNTINFGDEFGEVKFADADDTAPKRTPRTGLTGSGGVGAQVSNGRPTAPGPRTRGPVRPPAPNRSPVRRVKKSRRHRQRRIW